MKIICIGDTHYGEQNNSPKYNQQLNTFIDWVCELGKERGIENVVQFGDWYHHRNKLEVATINASIDGAKKLEQQFGKENVWLLVGNHDCPFLHRLDIHSLKTVDQYVTVINTPTQFKDESILIVPWITDNEMWNDVVAKGKEYKYLFSHLELNGFMVNDGYAMEGGYSHRELRDYQSVLSGHYHSKQIKDNVNYLGTPIPITMNEANESHGIYILDTETDEIEYIEYDAVKVISIPYDRFDEIRDLDPENTYVRIEFPDDLEDETLIGEIQEELKELNFTRSKIKYTSQKVKKLMEVDITDVAEVENIDGFVVTCIDNMQEIEGIDRVMLRGLYQESIEMTKEMQ